jgi:hypothetical protein
LAVTDPFDARVPEPAGFVRMRALCLFDAPLHERPAVVSLGEQLVMGAARDVDVRRGGRTTSAIGLLMMELEQAALAAANAFGTDEISKANARNTAVFSTRKTASARALHARRRPSPQISQSFSCGATHFNRRVRLHRRRLVPEIPELVIIDDPCSPLHHSFDRSVPESGAATEMCGK